MIQIRWFYAYVTDSDEYFNTKDSKEDDSNDTDDKDDSKENNDKTDAVADADADDDDDDNDESDNLNSTEVEEASIKNRSVSFENNEITATSYPVDDLLLVAYRRKLF